MTPTQLFLFDETPAHREDDGDEAAPAGAVRTPTKPRRKPRKRARPIQLDMFAAAEAGG